MDVNMKLRLIQEGYSFQEINEAAFNFPHQLKESNVPDFLLMNADYIVETTMDILTESSDDGFLSYIRKFFKWIKEKVMQFIAFIKSKFSPKKSKTEAFKASWKENYEQFSKIEGMKNVNYEMTVHSHIYDKTNYDFLGNGIEKVFNIIDDRIQRIIGTITTEAKVVMFTDSVIDDEKRFLDSIFAEVFKTPYSEESIYENLYGPIKKVIVWPLKDMDYLYEKSKHLDEQQTKIINFANDHINSKLKSYEEIINKQIKYSLDTIDDAKKKNKWNIVNDEQKVIAKLRTKLESLTKIYNYMFKLSADFVTVHNSVSFKFLDGLSQITLDMAGEIRLPTKSK